MSTPKHLGEFEHLLLLAIMRQGNDISGSDVTGELTRRTGRAPARGTMYVTLDRLERKGYLESDMGDPTPERGGKAKRMYSITPAGVEALKRSGQALQAMWQGYESLLEDA
jgi:PadR family transcriptional regulator PadR